MADHAFTVEQDEVGLGDYIIVQDGHRECVTGFGDKDQAEKRIRPRLPDGCSTPRRRQNKMTKLDRSNELGSFERPASKNDSR
jgi:hypothetical protein